MSDALFVTRLRFHDGRGRAKLQGRAVELTEPPQVAGTTVDELDYCPEVGTAEIRPSRSERRREMFSEEILACEAFLRALAPAMR
jgi:hypothetical protein